MDNYSFELGVLAIVVFWAALVTWLQTIDKKGRRK